MADVAKLKWVELSPEMFPKNVQDAINAARKARQTAAELTAAADKLIQGFAPRIQVEGAALVQAGEEMVISHRFGKLTVASAPKTAKAQKASKAILA